MTSSEGQTPENTTFTDQCNVITDHKLLQHEGQFSGAMHDISLLILLYENTKKQEIDASHFQLLIINAFAWQGRSCPNYKSKPK